MSYKEAAKNYVLQPHTISEIVRICILDYASVADKYNCHQLLEGYNTDTRKLYNRLDREARRLGINTIVFRQIIRGGYDASRARVTLLHPPE